jgi:hypothetical protein
MIDRDRDRLRPAFASSTGKRSEHKEKRHRIGPAAAPDDDRASPSTDRVRPPSGDRRFGVDTAVVAQPARDPRCQRMSPDLRETAVGFGWPACGREACIGRSARGSLRCVIHAMRAPREVVMLPQQRT